MAVIHRYVRSATLEMLLHYVKQIDLTDPADAHDRLTAIKVIIKDELERATEWP